MDILLVIASVAVLWTALSALIVAVGVAAHRRKEAGKARAWADLQPRRAILLVRPRAERGLSLPRLDR